MTIECLKQKPPHLVISVAFLCITLCTDDGLSVDVNDVSNHHIQIWWWVSMFISRYDHFYCCFIKWSVNFLLIQCFVIKGLYFIPYLFPEDGILKFIKYHLSLKTGANPIYCSFFLSKWWTSELKRCKCSHLAQKVADIYEHVLLPNALSPLCVSLITVINIRK